MNPSYHLAVGTLSALYLGAVGASLFWEYPDDILRDRDEAADIPQRAIRRAEVIRRIRLVLVGVAAALLVLVWAPTAAVRLRSAVLRRRSPAP